MKKGRKETKKISLFGKQQNQVNPSGSRLGEMDAQAGILNAQPWRARFWEKI